MSQMLVQKQKPCEVCGTTFTYRSKDQRGCSDKCRNRIRSNTAKTKRVTDPKPKHKKMCSICLTEYETYRSNQTCCSAKCRKEKKNIREKLAQKEKRRRQRKHLEAQCLWKDCTETVIRDGQAYMRKFCPEHSKARQKLSRQKAIDKRRQQIMESRVGLKCAKCGKQLPPRKQKFCSYECQHELERVNWKRLRIERKVKKYETLARYWQGELDKL